MTNILQNRCISGKITANEAEVIVNKKKRTKLCKCISEITDAIGIKINTLRALS
jgi:hypothetical protein